MTGVFRAVLVSAVCSTTLVPLARAQMPAHIVVNAGAAIPTGDFSDGNDVGYIVGVGVQVAPPASPMAVRVEGTYAEFNESGIGGKSIVDGGAADLLFSLSSAGAKTPGSLYAIGGIGYYGTREPVFDGGYYGYGTYSQSNVGWNIGGGFRFPLTGFDTFVEARYVTVTNTDVHYVPIVFGVVF